MSILEHKCAKWASWCKSMKNENRSFQDKLPFLSLSTSWNISLKRPALVVISCSFISFLILESNMKERWLRVHMASSKTLDSSKFNSLSSSLSYQSIAYTLILAILTSVVSSSSITTNLNYLSNHSWSGSPLSTTEVEFPIFSWL